MSFVWLGEYVDIIYPLLVVLNVLSVRIVATVMPILYTCASLPHNMSVLIS